MWYTRLTWVLPLAAIPAITKAAEARKSLAKALELNPKRVWAKTQFEKTPEK